MAAHSIKTVSQFVLKMQDGEGVVDKVKDKKLRLLRQQHLIYLTGKMFTIILCIFFFKKN